MTYMTVKEARYHNAKKLQDSLPGGQREFCEKLNKAQSQVSSFLGENPVKGIGDKIAEQIEKAFGKPKGWLDTPHFIESDNKPSSSLFFVDDKTEEPKTKYFLSITDERNDTRLLYVALVEAEAALKSQEEMFGESYSYYDLARSTAELFRELRNENVDIDQCIREIREQEHADKAKTG